MRRQAVDHVQEQRGSLSRLRHPAGSKIDLDRSHIGVMAVVGVRDLGKKFEPTLRPRMALHEITGTPRDVGKSGKRVRAKPSVSELFGDRVQSAGRSFVLSPERYRCESSRVRGRAFDGELERTLDPLVNAGANRFRRPHSCSAYRLKRELGVQLGGRAGELDRLLHRCPRTLRRRS